MRKIFSMAAITAVTLIALLVWHFAAHAHDHSRPELNSWFEGLHIRPHMGSQRSLQPSSSFGFTGKTQIAFHRCATCPHVQPIGNTRLHTDRILLF
jgi:hypothetical protein